jgi:hypothetical protein
VLRTVALASDPVRFVDADELQRDEPRVGPAEEALRLAGEQGVEMRPELERLLHGALGQFVQDDGEVEAQASTWIVSARA